MELCRRARRVDRWRSSSPEPLSRPFALACVEPLVCFTADVVNGSSLGPAPLGDLAGRPAYRLCRAHEIERQRTCATSVDSTRVRCRGPAGCSTAFSRRIASGSAPFANGKLRKAGPRADRRSRCAMRRAPARRRLTPDGRIIFAPAPNSPPWSSPPRAERPSADDPRSVGRRE